MLVSRREGRLFLVSQNDHGVLAGQLVDLWGNERFAAPAPHEAVRTAAAMHDDGWRLPDAEPLFNEAEGRPLHFLEIPMTEHVPLYGRGVDEVFRQDPYAGLLVSMHWTGLYRGRWGMQAGAVRWKAGETLEERLQDDAVDEQERRWIDVKHQLLAGERRSDFEANLWHNFELLQAYDFLSLFACLANHAPAADEAQPEVLANTLKSIDQVPGPRLIRTVPTAVAGEQVELTLRAVEPGVVTVDPYPFRDDDLELRVDATTIDDRRYADQDDLRAALQQGETVTIACRMTRRDTPS